METRRQKSYVYNVLEKTAVSKLEFYGTNTLENECKMTFSNKLFSMYYCTMKELVTIRLY